MKKNMTRPSMGQKGTGTALVAAKELPISTIMSEKRKSEIVSSQISQPPTKLIPKD